MFRVAGQTTASRDRGRYSFNNMKKIIHSHSNLIIIVLALIFLGVLAALYSWTINGIVLDAHRAISSLPAESASGFDLTGAAALDLRGILYSVTTAAAATTTAITTPTVPATNPSSLDNTFNASNTSSIAQQLSGLTQAIPDDNPNVVPVIFSDLQFTSIANPITVDVSVADTGTAAALNNALGHSSHFTDVEASGESTATSGRITYSITFVYVP